MTLRWASAVLNDLIAPDFSAFTHADIPSLSERFPQAPYWLSNYFLNAVGRADYRPPTKQLVLAFLRRAHDAFANYHDAKRATEAYLNGNDPHSGRLTPYYRALTLWEEFALQMSIATDLYRRLSGQKVFEKNDGSKEQRLYDMANRIKHVSTWVGSDEFDEAHVLPLWLSNDGLLSSTSNVTFAEASEVLAGIATIADKLQDPLSLQQQHADS